jgi:hypothetical protein
VDEVREELVVRLVSSFRGTIVEPYRCVFFLLLEDYIEEQMLMAHNLDSYLERFARNLGDAGVLIRPFVGDVEATQQEVLMKNWTEEEREALSRTPGLLMISRDFGEFDPRSHPWFHLHTSLMQGATTTPSPSEFGAHLGNLALAVREAQEEDIFNVAYSVTQESVEWRELVDIFEAKPGVFGFSIDLKRGASFLWKLYDRQISAPRV